KRAIKKYGLENFKKEILFFAEISEEMFKIEKDLVDINDPLSYNLKMGGCGGWDYINKNLTADDKQIKRAREIHLQKYYSDKEYKDHCLKKNKESRIKCKDQISKTHKEKYKNGYIGIFTGKKHSKETIEHLKKVHKGKHSKEKNSQFGTMWITNGLENKKIKKDDEIPQGWYKGRKIKILL
ncbi:MAG: hypothetical protein AABW88_04690, partial [Nanoarchaeota archaeon]